MSLTKFQDTFINGHLSILIQNWKDRITYEIISCELGYIIKCQSQFEINSIISILLVLSKILEKIINFQISRNAEWKGSSESFDCRCTTLEYVNFQSMAFSDSLP